MPVRELQPLPWFKRNQTVRHSRSAIQELADSLRRHGQLQDLGATGDGTVIWGNGRLAAAPLAGMKELWVQVYKEPLKPEEIEVIRLVENIHRENPSAYELAASVRSLVEEFGLELKEVAARLGKSPTWVTRYLYPFKCVPPALEAFKAGTIGVTDCEALAKLGEQQELEWLAAKLNGSATRDDLAKAATRQRKPESGVRVTRIQFPLTSGITIKLTGEGLTLDGGIDALQEAVKAMRKGRADSLNAKTFQAVMASKAKGGE